MGGAAAGARLYELLSCVMGSAQICMQGRMMLTQAKYLDMLQSNAQMMARSCRG